ncbi:dynein light chain type 1 [Trichuris suis]|nr:dynein light chain type 1 [Trichuris suis]
MPENMRQRAVDLAKEALEKFEVEREMASYLKKGFEQTFGPTWHCIVGRQFSSYVTHENGSYIYFYLGKEAWLLFKSA